MDWRLRKHRRRNYNIPGHAHALTFTCYQRYQFLTAERTCEWLADEINLARAEFDFALWAFVFMPEHVRLVIFPRREKYDMADIRKAIKEPVARKAIKYLSDHSPEWLERVTRKLSSRTTALQRLVAYLHHCSRWPGLRLSLCEFASAIEAIITSVAEARVHERSAPDTRRRDQ